MVEKAQNEAAMRFQGAARKSIPSRTDETFIVDVDAGTILSIQDFKRGNTRGYQGAVQFDIPTFFEQISQSGMFNGPNSIIELAKEVQASFEDRIFSKSLSWQKLI